MQYSKTGSYGIFRRSAGRDRLEITKRYLYEDQQKIKMLHSVPGLHIPGTLICTDLTEKDDIDVPACSLVNDDLQDHKLFNSYE